MYWRTLVLIVSTLALRPEIAAAQSQFDIVHAFTQGGTRPTTGLVYATDGNFYGTTSEGGTGWGTVFRMSAEGTVTAVHSFSGGSDGAVPEGRLIQGFDGHLYGTTHGWSNALGESGCGTVFRMTLGGAVTTLHAFAGSPDGCRAYGGLVQGWGGNFYGTTASGGAHGQGTIFRLDPFGDFALLYSFGGGADGAAPNGDLVQGADGHFYGTTLRAGASGRGTVFRVTSGGTLTPLYAFQGVHEGGAWPLTPAPDGSFYGTTFGTDNWDDFSDPGTIFRITSDGAFTRLHLFQRAEGWNPVSPLVRGSDGNFYGTSVPSYYTSDVTRLFKMAPDGTVSSVRTLGQGGTYGLMQAPDGNLYGVNPYANDLSYDGSIVRMPKDGSTYSVVHRFTYGPNGRDPMATLVRARDGNLYGTTWAGGEAGVGTVFKIAPSGTLTSLYSFPGDDRASTETGLIQAADGKLYGQTGNTVFSITPDGSYSVVGAVAPPGTRLPEPSTLAQGVDGSFYGTTVYDGFSTCGTIFKMTPSGAVTTVHRFTGLYGGGQDGCNGGAALVQHSSGAFIGVTQNGGAANKGTIVVVSVWPTLRTSILHAFTGGPDDGSGPRSAPTLGSDGYFYGVTSYGGQFDRGVAYRVSISGEYGVLRSFEPTEGSPWGALVEGPDRNFYGLSGGGAFVMTRQGAVTFVHRFDPDAQYDAGYGHGGLSLTWAGGGDFYGVAAHGPTHYGIVFRLRVRGTVSGRLMRDGRPLANARVIFQPGGATTLTDATGDYTMVLPIGTYTVTATADHRVSRVGRVTVAGNGTSWDAMPASRGDFDGDGLADLMVWRPSTGTWSGLTSADGHEVAPTWGAGMDPYNDVPVPADYDGDGTTDIAVWRPKSGTWWIVRSTDGRGVAMTWGAGGAPHNDVPVPADYDGDGKTDIAVWRPATGDWWIFRSSDGTVLMRTYGSGLAPYNDVPVPADYDGDGKADVAVWRRSTGGWFINRSSGAPSLAVTWGAGADPYNDVPVPADYDGDGKTDLAVWRPSSGTWWIVRSADGAAVSVRWGAGEAPYNDVPVPADYDGDGLTDVAVWRPASGTWWIIRSSDGFGVSLTWGAGDPPYNDVPVTGPQRR